MSLNRTAFVRELSLLHERFGRTPSEHVIARYYETLARELDTAEFERAARYVFDHDRFWPAPARFVELARGTPEQGARQEWQQLIDGAMKGERARLTPAGEAALMAAGGWREVAYADTDRKLPRLERAFLRAYQHAAEDRALAELPDGTSSLDLEVHE